MEKKIEDTCKIPISNNRAHFENKAETSPEVRKIKNTNRHNIDLKLRNLKEEKKCEAQRRKNETMKLNNSF